MRTTVLTLFVALFASTAAVAQTPTTKASGTTAVSRATDEFTQQRRDLSGELKNTLAVADGLTKRAVALYSSSSGPEQEQYMSTASSLKAIKVSIMDQLDLVNKVAPAESADVFAEARKVMASTKVALEEHKMKLGTGSKEPVTK